MEKMKRREIKFRFWNHVESDNSKSRMFYDTEQVMECLKQQINFNNKHRIGFDHEGSGSAFMQYTGLKDKNGKEIYCGDILSSRWKVEVYQNEEGTFMVKFHTNPSGNKPMSLLKYLKHREKAGTSEEDCVIIGNIYSNPELLTTS